MQNLKGCFLINKYSNNIKTSPEVEVFINNGGTLKVISPEETRKTLEKQSGGYFKGQSVMGPSKKKGKTS